ncbi:MAG: DUF2079 domain-containing protein, partial [Candidatus Levyibacteriota bacterium]
LLQPSRIEYLIKLFAPIGYLSILFPFFLVFAAPDLLINTLSNNPQLHQIYFQYTSTITPFIFLSAIYGVWVLRKFSIFRLFRKHFAIIIGTYLLVMAFYGAFAFGPLPGAKESNLDMFVKPLENRAAIDAFLNQIPNDDTVAGSNDVGSHLSHRDTIYTVPAGIDRADVVVLILTDPKAKDAYNKVQKDPHYQEVEKLSNFAAFTRVP